MELKRAAHSVHVDLNSKDYKYIYHLGNVAVAFGNSVVKRKKVIILNNIYIIYNIDCCFVLISFRLVSFAL